MSFMKGGTHIVKISTSAIQRALDVSTDSQERLTPYYPDVLWTMAVREAEQAWKASKPAVLSEPADW